VGPGQTRKVQRRKLDTESGEPSEQRGDDVSIGGGAGDGAGGAGGTTRSMRRFRKAPDGATTTAFYEVFERPPIFHMLIDPEEIIAKGLRDAPPFFTLTLATCS
jgi:hypothetical protein